MENKEICDKFEKMGIISYQPCLECGEKVKIVIRKRNEGGKQLLALRCSINELKITKVSVHILMLHRSYNLNFELEFLYENAKLQSNFYLTKWIKFKIVKLISVNPDN
ncbi:hypothetical protein BpHYR1_025479 [Brachionus plicatilis]|uniref:Uncharacterized protein n=1 Tax=Brachionus plicatilis TaxID=10195 RepID=A0A3M7PAV7_BRAPC|nr:hypothetical protein BpHYR1_025479 [Brachionus plicatilis]